MTKGVYNAGGGRCDSHEYLCLWHYFSMLQNMHYFQNPTAGKVKICNMTDSLNDMEADVLVMRMKHKQYCKLSVSIKNDSYNCEVYVLHSATCK
eukprot:14892420-Ditylum_brightwellii.AAC.1